MTSIPVSQWQRFRRRFGLPAVSVSAAIGLLVIVVTIVFAVGSSVLAPNELSQIIGTAYEGPSGTMLLGTDVAGRDTWSRLIHGARLTIWISAVATFLAYLVGLSIGFLAAEWRGLFDASTVWVVDTLLSIPSFLWVLLIVASLDPNLPVLIGAIATSQLPSIIRLSRSLAMNIAAQEFVESARARKEGTHLILFREILPNTIRPLSADFGIRLNFSIILLSSVSFLGLGVQPPEADWGSLIRENLTGLQTPGFMAVLAPAIAIGLLSVAINLVVDWLQSTSEAQIPEELAK